MPADAPVHLLRQVPVDDATPRSWLGGLPRMPQDLPWPERQGRPLHFLAQICCADLPAALWGGIGPRHGWLLVFIDALDEFLSPDAHKVLHIDRDGPERPAPAALGPVDHEHVRIASLRHHDPRRVWRRWPADPTPRPPADAGVSIWGAPGATEEDLLRTDSFSGAPMLAGVLAGIFAETRRRISAVQATPPPAGPEAIAPLLAADLALCRALVARAEAGAGGNAQEARMLGLTAPKAVAWHEALEAAGGAAALAARHRAHREAVEAAAAALAPVVAAQEATAAAMDPFAPCARGWWTEFYFSTLYPRWAETEAARPEGRPHIPGQARLDVSPPLPNQHHFHLNQQVCQRDWLADRVASGAPIPADLRPEILRAMRGPRGQGTWMGGARAHLQNGPSPEDPVLLLQVASDDQMGWCWGDVGMLFFQIAPEALARGDFSGVTLRCESY